MFHRRFTKLYEESDSKLNDATDELEAMKKYLHEALEEVDKFRNKINSVITIHVVLGHARFGSRF